METLKKAGFATVAERDGHVKLARAGPGALWARDRIVVVPPAVRGQELAVGTLKAVLEQAGLEREEFEDLAAQRIEGV